MTGSIKSHFRRRDGDVLELFSGEVWKVVGNPRCTFPAYADVLVQRSNGRWEMTIEGIEPAGTVLRVRRLR